MKSAMYKVFLGQEAGNTKVVVPKNSGARTLHEQYRKFFNGVSDCASPACPHIGGNGGARGIDVVEENLWWEDSKKYSAKIKAIRDKKRDDYFREFQALGKQFGLKSIKGDRAHLQMKVQRKPSPADRAMQRKMELLRENIRKSKKLSDKK